MMKTKTRVPKTCVLEACAVLPFEQMMFGDAADAGKHNVEGTQRRKWSHLIITVISGMLDVIS